MYYEEGSFLHKSSWILCGLVYLKRLKECMILLQNQKRIGRVLEKERTSFPRFYFVGDEDLLEILGNSRDINRWQYGIFKIFAGITSLTIVDGFIGFDSLESIDLSKTNQVRANQANSFGP
jgi:hypothetical protein